MAPEMLLLASYRGTLHEAAATARIGPALDVWSFGVCIFELVAGYKPFQVGPGVRRHLWHRLRRCSAAFFRGCPERLPGCAEPIERRRQPPRRVKPKGASEARSSQRSPACSPAPCPGLLCIQCRPTPPRARARPRQGVSYAGVASAVLNHAREPLPHGVSPELASFLDACFTHDAATRPTAAQLLSHPWVAPAASHTEAAAMGASAPVATGAVLTAAALPPRASARSDSAGSIEEVTQARSRATGCPKACAQPAQALHGPSLTTAATLSCHALSPQPTVVPPGVAAAGLGLLACTSSQGTLFGDASHGTSQSTGACGAVCAAPALGAGPRALAGAGSALPTCQGLAAAAAAAAALRRLSASGLAADGEGPAAARGDKGNPLGPPAATLRLVKAESAPFPLADLPPLLPLLGKADQVQPAALPPSEQQPPGQPAPLTPPQQQPQRQRLSDEQPQQSQPGAGGDVPTRAAHAKGESGAARVPGFIWTGSSCRSPFADPEVQRAVLAMLLAPDAPAAGPQPPAEGTQPAGAAKAARLQAARGTLDQAATLPLAARHGAQTLAPGSAAPRPLLQRLFACLAPAVAA
jgi:hypothetical protein